MSIRHWLLPVIVLLVVGASASAATTYYVSPTGSNSLSTNSSSPGLLSYAVANAPSGTSSSYNTVILENGTYDGSAYSGFTVANSYLLFQAQTWHGATIKNSTASTLISPGASSQYVTFQGVIFGPATTLGWSGGGGAGWQFLDCVFTQQGGVGAGNNCLFLHDLFTDNYSNSFDLAGTNQEIQDSIVRRSNRANGDEDSVGNKCDYTTDLTMDGLVGYDNAGPAIWFDTSNDGWTVKNSTFFANHGGANWFYFNPTSGSTTTTVIANGQDGEEPATGTSIMCIGGTTANLNHSTTIQSISGSWPGPYTAVVSPALPAAPVNGDEFAAQHPTNLAVGDGFITEANDDGVFTNNVLYNNSDAGYFDHSSGGTTYGGIGGLTITDNLFAYNPEGVFVWSDARDQGPATIQYNQFKFLPGTSGAFDSWGSTPGTYPGVGQIAFDYNDYNPDNSNGSWAAWFSSNPPKVAGGLTSGSQPSGQDYLQNTSTWDQDLHGNTNAVTFIGSQPAVSIWPASGDTSWTDIYFPNNAFGTSGSIHQINDANGSTTNTIDAALSGKTINQVITIPVSAHTPIVSGVCQVYDLNGRWVTLTVPSANQTAFLAAVPSYVTCTTSNATQTYSIQVTLNSLPPYNVTATYNPSGGTGGGGSLTGGQVTASTSTYNLTSLGSSDWAHWNGTFNHKSSGGTQISNVTQTSGGSFGTWHSTSRNVSWTDGTPTTSNTDDQNYIWCNGTTGQGWTFTAPASTTSRTLYILCGGGPGANIKINAHLSDGSSPDYTDTETVSSSPYTYLYSITYKAASAGQTLTITLTKNDSNGAISVDLDAAWLGGGTVTGSMSGSEATASTSTYALTTLGTTDWSHWNNVGWIHDSSGSSQISNVTPTTGGSFGNWSASTRNVSWTNGTPTSSNSDDNYYIWCNGTTGQGWTFTAPATTTSHTLYVLCGGDGATPFAATKLNAHLSDGSAADYTDTRTTTTSANLYLYTITYNAASSGQTLTITLTKNDTDSGTSVDLDAAWLH
jgi:hypothetical protein